MLIADQLNIELLPAFIGTKESLPFYVRLFLAIDLFAKEQVEQFLANQISKIIDKKNSVNWGRSLSIMKAVAAFHKHYTPKIITPQLALEFAVGGFQNFGRLLTTNLATPADSLILLQVWYLHKFIYTACNYVGGETRLCGLNEI